MKTPQGMVYEGDFEDGLPHGKVGAMLSRHEHRPRLASVGARLPSVVHAVLVPPPPLASAFRALCSSRRLRGNVIKKRQNGL